ncbi:MAG: COG1361 S-layer family protein [Methanosarcinaceae archaeon]
MTDRINYKNIMRPIFFLVLVFAVSITPVPASSGAALKVDIVKYEPYPAEIGKQVDIWVKIENVGYGRADDASMELVPSYPFTLDSTNNAVKNIGILSPDSAAVHEYHLFVDKDAKPGTGTIKIRYQFDEGTSWYEDSFEIKVGADTLDSRGTLKLETIRIDPEVMMPGDSGTVAVTLTNTASQYSVTIDGKDYDTNAHLKEVELLGSDRIKVTTGTYRNMGVLGPGDSIDLSFNIKINPDAEDGTGHLALALTGSTHTYNANWNIPVKVDSAGIKIIPSKPMKLVDGIGKIEFDVANTCASTFTSVCIKPQADGIVFTPNEYFIGTMEPDELYTIEFDAEVTTNTGTNKLVDAGNMIEFAGNSSGGTDLHLYAEYRNGNNRHEVILNSRVIDIEDPIPKSNSTPFVAGATLLLFAAAGGIYFAKRRK